MGVFHPRISQLTTRYPPTVCKLDYSSTLSPLLSFFVPLLLICFPLAGLGGAKGPLSLLSVLSVHCINRNIDLTPACFILLDHLVLSVALY